MAAIQWQILHELNMDKQTTEQAQTNFIRARIQLLSSHPFYGSLAMRMPLEWLEGCPGGLSCTDGRTLYIEPTAFNALSRPEQVTVIVHELLHCAAQHLMRVGSRDPLRWNIAGDIYIANVTEADGFTPVAAAETFLQGQGIRRADYRNMATEEIYDKLPASVGPGKGKGSSRKGDPSGGGCGHWQGDGGCYRAPQSAAEASQMAAEWRQAVVEASQMAGSKAGAWSELVKAAMPRPPFHLKLFEYLSRGLGGDTSFDVFDRRWLARGLYLPATQRQVMGEIAVAVDTSGSMGTEQLQLAFGYIRAFREQHPCTLHLIQCDYDAISEGQYAKYGEWEALPSEFKAIGRGGTSFNAPFKLLRDKGVEPKVFIYLSDLYGECTAKAPNYPVLWVGIKGDKGWKPPFGEVCQVA